MTDYLIEINQKNLRNLRKLYISDGKRSYITYMTINNYICWFEQDPNLEHVKCFSLNGDFSDGTFIVTNRCEAYADTLNESNDRLHRLLQLIDYSKGYMFLSVRTEIKPIIERAVEKYMEITNNETALLYHLSKEEALKFDVQAPDGIELRPICESCDIAKANSEWDYCDSNTLGLFQRWAKYNPNAGAFKEDGTLVAWLFCDITGLLSALQTDKMYYGKGYAELVTRCVSKKMAEKGYDVYAGIFETNTPSRSLFAKLGFKSIGEIHWLGVYR